MAEVIVVGIGNPYRGDDAAGWAVIDALKDKVNNSVKLDKQRGDVAELLEIFGRYTKVFLVDAYLSSSAVGSWERINASKQTLPIENSQTSTHGLSVSQAIDLAKNLDMLPAKIIIYAIAGKHFKVSDSMSPIVAETIDQVVKELLKEEDITHARV